MDTTPTAPGIGAMCPHTPMETSQSYGKLRHHKVCTPKAVHVFLTASFALVYIVEKHQRVILSEHTTRAG